MREDNKKLTVFDALELDNAIHILAPEGQCGSEIERKRRVDRFIENLKYRTAAGACGPSATIDAVFELVRKYQSEEELDAYCVKCVYFDSEENARVYNEEIKIRAAKLLDSIKNAINDYEYNLKNAVRDLKFNEEYKELKRVVDEIKISRSVREIIEAKIAAMESNKNSSEEMIRQTREKLVKILEGDDAKLVDGNLPPAAAMFFYHNYPSKREKWFANHVM